MTITADRNSTTVAPRKPSASDPIPLKVLRLEMVRRSLTLRDVARAARVPYTSASGIITGRLIQPANLKKIVAAIAAAPIENDQPEITPEEFHQQMHEALHCRPGKKISLTKA